MNQKTIDEITRRSWLKGFRGRQPRGGVVCIGRTPGQQPWAGHKTGHILQAEGNMASMFSKRVHLTAVLAILAILMFSDWAPAQTGTPGAWCVLRRHNVYEPANCFEFFLCDTTNDIQRCVARRAAARAVSNSWACRRAGRLIPTMHPQNNPVPYVTWQGADYVMSVLGRFHGDWYGCLGQRRMELPQRICGARRASRSRASVSCESSIPQWPP